MIDLEKIVERIQSRLKEIGSNPTQVSLQATGSKDTIRNWVRAVEEDRRRGTRNASASTRKLNQIEQALGIELARHVSENFDVKDQLEAALLAYGVDPDDIKPVMTAIKGFVDAASERQALTDSHDQSAPATPRRARVT